jgi:hypothetical protein
MLAPRPWGLSLLKIRRHKHLLNDFVLIVVLRIPHDLDDFIGQVLGLADASLGLRRVLSFVIVLYLYLRGAGAHIGAQAGRTLGTIVTKVSLFATGKALACLHEVRSLICSNLPGSDTVYLHRVGVLRFWSQGLLPLFFTAILPPLDRVF